MNNENKGFVAALDAKLDAIGDKLKKKEWKVPTDLLGMEMEFTLAADGGTYIHNTDEELITKEIIYTVAQTQDGLTVTLRPVGEKRDLLVLNTNDAGDLVAEDDFGLQMIFEKQTQD